MQPLHLGSRCGEGWLPPPSHTSPPTLGDGSCWGSHATAHRSQIARRPCWRCSRWRVGFCVGTCSEAATTPTSPWLLAARNSPQKTWVTRRRPPRHTVQAIYTDNWPLAGRQSWPGRACKATRITTSQRDAQRVGSRLLTRHNSCRTHLWVHSCSAMGRRLLGPSPPPKTPTSLYNTPCCTAH